MTAGTTALHVFADRFRAGRRIDDRRRGQGAAVPERHARPGARGRPAAPGRARRLHGVGHGHLGQRRAEAAGVRLSRSCGATGPTSTPSSTRRSGRRPPTTSQRTVRMRPLAWGDSFGFRHVITRIARRHRAGAAGRPQDPHDPVRHLREGGRADGREPDADGVRRGLHVAADRRHRRLRARREHDAAAAVLRGRALHGAHRPHRRRARPVGVDRSRWRGCRPTCARCSSGRRSKPARQQRAIGAAGGRAGDRAARASAA